MREEELKVLVACEFSGIIRDAFLSFGHDAISCDLLPTKSPGPHYQGDVLRILNNGWDLMIACPPCTCLTVTANKHFLCNPERWEKRYKAMLFVWELWNAPIEKIAIENPISVISSYIKKPDQIIHPYYFGDPIPKRTGLWLKNLPPLQYKMTGNMFGPKTAVEPEYVEYNSKKLKGGKSKYGVYGRLGKGHGKERSIFFPGIAKAMAAQWGQQTI